MEKKVTRSRRFALRKKKKIYHGAPLNVDRRVKKRGGAADTRYIPRVIIRRTGPATFQRDKSRLGRQYGHSG